MAKRTSSTTRTSEPKAAARKSVSSKKTGDALGQQVQETQENMTLTPKDMAREVAKVSMEMIAQRAYEIWKSEGGSEMQNWLKAERELRGDSVHSR